MLDLIELIQGVSVGQILSGGTIIVLVIAACFEIAPIKVNPVSRVLAWFGKKINGPTIDRLEAKLDSISETVDDNEIDRIRWEILEFANSCRNHRKHTYDEFVHVIALNEKYHRILTKRKMTNGQIDAEYTYILALFKKCQEENNFL